jgi:hypothetical protein
MLKPACLMSAAIFALAGLLGAQTFTNNSDPAVVVRQDRVPATKLEGFSPAAGSVVMLGYDELGSIGSPPVNVDVRQMSDTKGGKALGLAVEVTENWYRRDSSLVDADEIPGLLKGIDTLLDASANPTKFDNFEARYETKGELLLTAYSIGHGKPFFTVQAGRDSPVLSGRLSAKDMQKLRAMVEQAQQKISTIQSGK